MNLQALKDELTLDPIARGYAAMNDEQAAISLAAQDRQTARDTVDSGLLLAAIVRAEYDALSAAGKDYIRLLALAPELPLTATVKTQLGALFAAGTQTRTNLLALQNRPGTRAEELNLGGQPTPSDVADARRLP